MITDPVLVNDWHPITRSDAVAEGGLIAARLLEVDLVAWRSNGKIQVAHDLCVHRGSRLSLGNIQNGNLKCPYHGWEYGQEGKCEHIPAHPEQIPPAKARLMTCHVQEKYGMVWVCLGEPQQDIPDFPEEERPEFKKVLAGPYGPVPACATRVVENFLDVAHFPFIHGGILGDTAHAEIPEYQVDTGSDGITASDIRVYQPDPYGTGQGGMVKYVYRVTRPLSAYMAKDDEIGGRLSILMAVTPVDEGHTIAWFYVSLNGSNPPSDEEMILFQTKIFEQDVDIVASQRPELLPLDLQEELHMRCDRTSIAYRRWLRDKGVIFGVI
jgi:phenylpropionate dioxygenase-like ring-hydroxylating dioxygenase large terminal subunit